MRKSTIARTELWCQCSLRCSLGSVVGRAHSAGVIHPIIQLFEERAVLLEMQGSNGRLDDAIADLAAWMDLAQDHLTEDDWAVLGEIGGVLYREGRASGNHKSAASRRIKSPRPLGRRPKTGPSIRVTSDVPRSQFSQ